MDLIFIENGKHWIVDYKFKSKPKSLDTETWLKLERETYSPQLQAYQAIYQEASGEIANIVLYYPVQGLWVPINQV